MGEEKFVDKCAGQLGEMFAADDEDFPAEYPLSYAQILCEQERDAALIDAHAKSPLHKKETFNHANKKFELELQTHIQETTQQEHIYTHTSSCF